MIMAFTGRRGEGEVQLKTTCSEQVVFSCTSPSPLLPVKAIIITRPGGPEVLEIQARPKPEPSLGQIRVRVTASALNRADLLQREGNYPVPAGYPADISGMEYAGEVDALGPGASM